MSVVGCKEAAFNIEKSVMDRKHLAFLCNIHHTHLSDSLLWAADAWPSFVIFITSISMRAVWSFAEHGSFVLQVEVDALTTDFLLRSAVRCLHCTSVLARRVGKSCAVRPRCQQRGGRRNLAGHCRCLCRPTSDTTQNGR